jgi:hypothetical protein
MVEHYFSGSEPLLRDAPPRRREAVAGVGTLAMRCDTWASPNRGRRQSRSAEQFESPRDPPIDSQRAPATVEGEFVTPHVAPAPSIRRTPKEAGKVDDSIISRPNRLGLREVRVHRHLARHPGTPTRRPTTNRVETCINNGARQSQREHVRHVTGRTSGDWLNPSILLVGSLPQLVSAHPADPADLSKLLEALAPSLSIPTVLMGTTEPATLPLLVRRHLCHV